ncbi:MAG: HEPN domain-containing protein, partial [Cyclobacteriaceae bacterium]|nr:HEPN domain-containing protein [Cyclobacteriaceae bacterium]
LDTTGILFGRTSQCRLKMEDAWDQVSELFKYIRVYSLQYDLNYKQFHSFFEPIERLRKSSVLPKEIHEFGLQEHRYLTNLTWTDFINIDKRKSRGQLIPVHREIFLDAASAHFENDYRKSILYFCMACETIVSEKLYEKYEELKKRRKLTHNINEAGQTKDPIYEILRKDKWQFRFKIHEQYTYLFNTSIRTEKRELYENLIKLYNTRNKIVHEGEIKVPNNDLLTIDSSGSNQAFDFTIEFWDWLGDTSFKVFSGRKYILVR